jgi:hypothetical protein
MAANVRHSSENSEFLTPQWLTDWARHVMGGIDGDPASSARANNTVCARWIMTKQENGLFHPWSNPEDGSPSRLFLNPPGGLVDEAGRAVIRKSKQHPGCTETGACGLPPGHKHTGVESSAVFWWHKLAHEFEAGRVECAVFLGFSLELLQGAQTFAGKHPLDFPCSFPKQRIRFETEDEQGVRHQADQPTHGNVIVLVMPRPVQPQQPLPPRAEYSNADERVRLDTLNRFEETFKQIGYVHVPRGY